MKKILLLLITTLSLIAASGTACNISAHTSEITQQKIVYITRTGVNIIGEIAVTCGKARCRQREKTLRETDIQHAVSVNLN